MILLISLLITCLSFYIFKACDQQMSIVKINMLSWIFYLHFVAMALIGSVLVIYGVDGNYIISTLSKSKQYIRFNVWLAVIYIMIAFPLSVLFVKKMLLKRWLQKNKLLRHNFVVSRSSCYALYVLTFIAISACIYTFYSFGYIGIVKILQDGYTKALRADWYNTRDINPYVKNILGLNLTKFLSYFYYIYWYNTRKKRFLILFCTTVVFAVMMQSMDMTKSTIVLYLISIYFLYVALNRGKVNFKIWLSLVVCSIMVIGTMYLAYHVSLDRLLYSLFHRIFTVQLEASYKMLELWPEKFDFIGLHSIRPYISWLLGIEYIERSATTLLRVTYGYPDGVPLPGGMVSLFFAEAWTNWGLIGIILSPLYAGVFTGLLYYLTKFSINTERLAIYALVSVAVPISEGINGFIYPVWLISTLLLYLFFLMLKTWFRYLMYYKHY